MNRQYNSYVEIINKKLAEICPGKEGVLAESMAYSLSAGGKRIRPVLTLAFCEVCGGELEKALPLACALEMIHTYSLIYDDMPCMDDDSLRRGKPTCHVVYGEAIALMAGAGLQIGAFSLVLESPLLSDKEKVEAMTVLANAAGEKGIVGGQVLDLQNDRRKDLSLEELETVHRMKTSAMLEAAALLGCIAAGADGEKKNAALSFAKKIGLAFQIKDDILDVIGSTEELGKTVGKDRKEEKTTFADLFGVEKAQSLVEEYTAEAKKTLSVFQSPEFLEYIAELLCSRRN